MVIFFRNYPGTISTTVSTRFTFRFNRRRVSAGVVGLLDFRSGSMGCSARVTGASAWDISPTKATSGLCQALIASHSVYIEKPNVGRCADEAQANGRTLVSASTAMRRRSRPMPVTTRSMEHGAQGIVRRIRIELEKRIL